MKSSPTEEIMMNLPWPISGPWEKSIGDLLPYVNRRVEVVYSYPVEIFFLVEEAPRDGEPVGQVPENRFSMYSSIPVKDFKWKEERT